MKYLIVSIHDATPNFLPELKIIFRELDKLNIKKYDILIVPNWDLKHPIKNKEFVSFIKRYLTKDSKLVLHGYTHKSVNQLHKKFNGILGPIGNFEYASLSEEEAERRIKKGLKTVRQLFGVCPVGFVPPAWAVKKRIKNIIKKYFKYYTTYNKIDYFQYKIKSTALCYTGGTMFYDKLMLLLSTLIARFTRNKIVRVAVHPDDVRNGNFERELRDLKLLIGRGRKLSLYEDFIV